MWALRSPGSSPNTSLGTGAPLVRAGAGAHTFPGEPPAVPASNIRPGSGTSSVASDPMFLSSQTAELNVSTSNALLAAPQGHVPTVALRVEVLVDSGETGCFL